MKALTTPPLVSDCLVSSASSLAGLGPAFSGASEGNEGYVPSIRNNTIRQRTAPFVCTAMLLAVPLMATPAAAGDAHSLAKTRPNVILVLTDDQGYGDLSCHGNPVLKTPHLDRLYAESIRFTDFHVSPMCTPTRGQLMTGVDCLRNGAMNVSSGRTLLRRWPQEVAVPIVSGVSQYRAVDGTYPAGVALPVAQARLRVADFDQSKPVQAADQAVAYTVRLKGGRTQLQTWFYDAKGEEICGAYYVYVQRK